MRTRRAWCERGGRIAPRRKGVQITGTPARPGSVWQAAQLPPEIRFSLARQRLWLLSCWRGQRSYSPWNSSPPPRARRKSLCQGESCRRSSTAARGSDPDFEANCAREIVAGNEGECHTRAPRDGSGVGSAGNQGLRWCHVNDPRALRRGGVHVPGLVPSPDGERVRAAAVTGDVERLDRESRPGVPQPLSEPGRNVPARSCRV